MLGSQPLAPFADLSAVSVSWRAGLVHRLILTLHGVVRPDVLDSEDEERRLLGFSLTALEGDLLLDGAEGLVLVAGLRALSPLPLSSEAAPRPLSLALFADLSAEQRGALAARAVEGVQTVLELRGQLLRWTNPLFDEQGYQHTRVGDKGMSRVIQAVGARCPEVIVGALRLQITNDEWRF